MKNRCINWSGGHHFLGSHTRISIVCLLLVCFALVGCIDESHLDLPGYGVFKPQIKLDEDKKDVSCDGLREWNLRLTTNVDYKIKNFNEDWVQVKRLDQYWTGNSYVVEVSIERNDSRKSRQAKVVFYYDELSMASDTLTIVQQGDPNLFKEANTVDLGLSVQWASWNLGAESPEDYGCYFSWGETWDEEYYDWSTYQFYDKDTEALTKYSIHYGGDNKSHLDSSDDAAHWRWGGDWRIPTLGEFYELIRECSWEREDFNDEISGYRVTGPNGNSIFLPCAGYRSQDGHFFHDSEYWSSTLSDNDYTYAYVIDLQSSSLVEKSKRYHGCSIRPVYGAAKQRITAATEEVTDVTSTGAKFNGRIYGCDGEIECGFLYSTQPNGVGEKLQTTIVGDYSQTLSSNKYSLTIDQLEVNTIYYYRAYVYIKDENRYEYGEIRSFRTSNWSTVQCEDENHVHAVDLGLSVKWACCNIDATSPEGYGGYYAWGETEQKEVYDWSTYKWYDNSDNEYVKYVISEYYEPYLDNKAILDLEDDVAHVKLGGDWRMPTADEIDELINECTWEYTMVNGVAGHKVTGPNGNSIFLPCAGYREEEELKEVNTSGNYWSSVKTSLGYVGGANRLSFMQAPWLDNQWYFENSEYSRIYGRSVRPVCGEAKPYILVATKSFDRLFESGATVFGHVCGVEQDVTCGVMYGTSSTLSSPYETMESTTSNGEFSFDLRDLMSKTTYYYRVYVCIDGEYTYGDIRSFTTSDYVTVETGDATNITPYEAELSGTLIGYDDDCSIGCGMHYGKLPDLSAPSTYSGGAWCRGTFTVTMKNLEPNTEYYYRAYVVAGDEMRFGEIRSFKTESGMYVTTGYATNITDTEATLSGEVKSTGKSYTSGIIYDMSDELSSTSGTMETTTSNGEYSINLSGLAPNTKYYYRTYVTEDGVYQYGEIKSFTTTKSLLPGQAIDLGLSVKWANCNVGAESPEDLGGRYAWGEIYEKNHYDWTTYKWCLGSKNTLTKYCIESSYGTIDNKTVLAPEDDVAHVRWGDEWRMPTEEEFKELREKCSFGSTTLNGVKGYEVVGPNGNSIFLPAKEESWDNSYMEVRYWGCELNENFSDEAHYLDIFTNDNVFSEDNVWWWSTNERCLAYSVRPVYGEVKPSISVTTGDATDVTDHSVTLNGKINNADASLDCGFIYGTSSNLSTSNGTLKFLKSDKDFSVSIDDLHNNTTYYYRAFVKVDGSYQYGETRSFQTKLTEVVSGKQVVDLGLSVKWASCNVGAESSVEYGGYYAWGETEEKSKYDWSTYKWCNGSSTTLTKYCTNRSYGTVDNKTTLDLDDDVAHVKWGDKWRMPTIKEWEELSNRCTWQLTTINGVNGYKVVGSNGNSIFLPAAGNSNNKSGSGGAYWSNMLAENYDNTTLPIFSFYDNNWGTDSRGSRYNGLSVRPVYDESLSITVTTGDATDITYNSVVLSGTINNFTASLNCGFIYGTSSDLSATKGTLVSANSKKDFSLTIKGLSDYTLYYYRSYVIVDGEYIYGEVKSFRTKREITITTVSAIDITLSSATLRGRISNAEASLTCGFVYGTSADLSATKGTLVTTKSQNSFNVSINGLSSNTTYYYRAYAIVNGEYIYGKVLSFTTEQAESGVEAVDLGLSVKWAPYNVGAIAPKEYGGYYAWGETEEKSDYSELTYSFKEKKRTLDPENDVAHVKWGGSWRMPTKAEMDELCNECTWTWTQLNGVDGMKVTGPNGNSIFLPVAGIRSSTSLVLNGSEGCYWSNTSDGNYVAYYLVFNSGIQRCQTYTYQANARGYSVRPVMDK